MSDKVREALIEIEALLTNPQPHIVQACYPGREGFIDNYVDPAIDLARAALASPPQEQGPGIEDLKAGLKFYADKAHFGISDESAWDTVSGEPQNFWCDEAGTATIEDGSVARAVLDGKLTAAQLADLDELSWEEDAAPSQEQAK